jgi:hypothetical protein
VDRTDDSAHVIITDPVVVIHENQETTARHGHQLVSFGSHGDGAVVTQGQDFNGLCGLVMFRLLPEVPA